MEGTMSVKRGLSIAIALVMLLAPGAAWADADRVIIEEVPLDEIFDYPCLGEPVHVTAIIRIMTAFSTDANGGIHAQSFITSQNAEAVGLTSGTPYRYRQMFTNVFYADSDFAPLVGHSGSTIELAQQGGGPKLQLTGFVQIVLDGDANVVVPIDRPADSCTP